MSTTPETPDPRCRDNALTLHRRQMAEAAGIDSRLQGVPHWDYRSDGTWKITVPSTGWYAVAAATAEGFTWAIRDLQDGRVLDEGSHARLSGMYRDVCRWKRRPVETLEGP